MIEDTALEAAVWAAAEGHASEGQLALLDADAPRATAVIDRLLDETEDGLDSVQGLSGPERDQVVADFKAQLHGLYAVYDRLNGTDEAAHDGEVEGGEDESDGRVRLQASWVDGEVVVWAGGRSVPPASNDELADLLEAIGGPALGWSVHRGVPLPGDVRAEAVSIPIADALGWLVAIGAGLGDEDDVGASVRWLG